jgi:chromosome segregation ATPase
MQYAVLCNVPIATHKVVMVTSVDVAHQNSGCDPLHDPSLRGLSGFVQELISSLNRRLDQLHNQASRAQDEASQRRQRAAVLEAQNELLNKDKQRLLHESTDHAAARYRLEAERDTQQRLSSQQHDDDAKERARLHAELSAIQRQLADCQKQLTEEQASHRHSFTAQEAADDRYDNLLLLLSKPKLSSSYASAHVCVAR